MASKKKKCKACGIDKPLSDFGKDKSLADGLRSKCRDCDNIWLREYRKANKDAQDRKLASFAVEQEELAKTISKKTCTACNAEKKLDAFQKSRRGQLGRTAKCKDCISQYERERRLHRGEKLRAKQRRYYARNKEEYNRKLKKKRDENIEAYRERERELRRADPERKRKKDREYRKRHLERLREKDRNRPAEQKAKRAAYRRQYVEKHRSRLYKENQVRNQLRLERDIGYRLRVFLGSRLRTALLGKGQKITSTTILLGCDSATLKRWLEFQFDSKMSWENYGLNGWHVDHWFPLAQCDLTQITHQLAVCNYRNLRPAWESENISKRDRVTQNAKAVFEHLLRVFSDRRLASVIRQWEKQSKKATIEKQKPKSKKTGTS